MTGRFEFLFQDTLLRKLRIAGFLFLAVCLLAEIFIPLHAPFSLADFFGFTILYAFITAGVIVFLVCLLAKLFQRQEAYYDD